MAIISKNILCYLTAICWMKRGTGSQLPIIEPSPEGQRQHVPRSSYSRREKAIDACPRASIGCCY